MRKLIASITLAVLVTGCGQNVPAAPDTAAPTAAQVTVAPAPTQAATASAPPAALVAQAQAQLAAHLGIDASALAVQQAQAQEWPDASLGCPQPGMMYPQVITPGYVLVFSDGDRTYNVHTDETMEAIILCNDKQSVPLTDDAEAAQPMPPSSTPTTRVPALSGRLPTVTLPTGQPAASGPPATGTTAQTMSDMAREKLAADLGVAANAVGVVSVREVEWRDGSLGCPQPGMMYPQVITPGFEVTLEADGARYTYHTNMRKQVVRCDNPGGGKDSKVTQ